MVLAASKSCECTIDQFIKKSIEQMYCNNMNGVGLYRSVIQTYSWFKRDHTYIFLHLHRRTTVRRPVIPIIFSTPQGAAASSSPFTHFLASPQEAAATVFVTCVLPCVSAGYRWFSFSSSYTLSLASPQGTNSYPLHVFLLPVPQRLLHLFFYLHFIWIFIRLFICRFEELIK